MLLKGKVKSFKMSQFKAVEKNGVIEKEKIDNSRGSVSVDNQFEFNRLGMITEQRRYISDKLSNKFIYEYDIDLNIIAKDYYDNSGNLMAESKFENIHHSEGELIEEKEYMTGENLDNNWTHKFFVNKNEIKEISYSGERAYDIREYFYNKNGNLIKENWNNRDGKVYIKTLYKYENGNIYQVSTFDSNDSLISKEKYNYLTYDHKKNWTKILISENDKPKNIIEAEIKYYK